MGGRLAFHTIEPTPNLSAANRRKASSIGPPGVAVRTSYPSLLRSARFTEIEMVDLTDEYLAAQRRWLTATLHHEHDLRGALGEDTVRESITRRRRTLGAIEEGLLLRRLYTAVR